MKYNKFLIILVPINSSVNFTKPNSNKVCAGFWMRNVNVGCLLFGPIRLNLLPADPHRGLSGLLQLPSILLYGLLDSKLQSTSSSAQLSTWSISCSVLISTARHGYPRGWKGCKIDNLHKSLSTKEKLNENNHRVRIFVSIRYLHVYVGLFRIAENYYY